MEKLQHDPRTKQQIKEMLYDYLYGPVVKHFQHKLLKIAQENCRKQNSPHLAFIYRGNTYCADTNFKMPRRLPRLHPSLKDEMDEYLREVGDLNGYEVPRVMGYINQVLNASNDLPDYLRMLPESVHQPIESYVSSCPCCNQSLSPSQVKEIKERNAAAIDLIKRRLTLNLLI